jgi:plastocyanin domain-containing protein
MLNHVTTKKQDLATEHKRRLQLPLPVKSFVTYATAIPNLCWWSKTRKQKNETTAVAISKNKNYLYIIKIIYILVVSAAGNRP